MGWVKKTRAWIGPKRGRHMRVEPACMTLSTRTVRSKPFSGCRVFILVAIIVLYVARDRKIASWDLIPSLARLVIAPPRPRPSDLRVSMWRVFRASILAAASANGNGAARLCAETQDASFFPSCPSLGGGNSARLQGRLEPRSSQGGRL